MKRIRYIAALFSAMLLLANCQTLEETYEDYAGDGKIRYLGKCSDISISPGWKRLIVKWENGLDATVEHIKVVWTGAEVKDSVLLPSGTTTFDIEKLGDDTYRIDICALDGMGRKSLVETAYGRPYTEKHEVVRTFTRGITKFFKVNDNLFCFLDKWDENIVDMQLKYTPAGEGEEETALPLNESTFNNSILLVENVNTNKRIAVERRGRLKDCADTLRFDDYVLVDELNMVSDFKVAIQRCYGFTDKGENELKDFRHFLDTVRVLEFDYDITSFEDILYCPKLEKLVLGKNRYMNPDYKREENGSILHDAERSFNALYYGAKQLLSGNFSIERYNNHYVSWYDEGLEIIEMGNPELPELPLIPVSEIDTITCSIKGDVGYDAHLEYLIDNNPATAWEPLEKGSARTYEIVIGLKKEHMVNGIKIAQKLFNPDEDQRSANYLPGEIKLQYSLDQVEWHDVTYLDENTLGRSSGEVTLLPMAKPQKVKYIRATLVDRALVNVFNIKLADISLY